MPPPPWCSSEATTTPHTWLACLFSASYKRGERKLPKGVEPRAITRIMLNQCPRDPSCGSAFDGRTGHPGFCAEWTCRSSVSFDSFRSLSLRLASGWLLDQTNHWSGLVWTTADAGWWWLLDQSDERSRDVRFCLKTCSSVCTHFFFKSERYFFAFLLLIHW